MKITQMDKPTARFLHDEVRAALKAVAAKHGLDFKDGAGRYDPTGGSFSFRAEFKMKQIGGEDRELAEFKQWCGLFHLTPADYGKPFTFRGEAYRLTGFYPSSPKFGYRGTRLKDGKVYKFPSDILKEINAEAYKANRPGAHGWDSMTIGAGDVGTVSAAELAAENKAEARMS